MDHYDLTDRQKEIIRTAVKRNEEDKLLESGFLHVICGDDKCMLPDCGIELRSLADLDALCDVDLLKKERGRPNPRYRILNAAARAVRNNFQSAASQLRDGSTNIIIIDRSIVGQVAAGKDISQSINRTSENTDEVENLFGFFYSDKISLRGKCEYGEKILKLVKPGDHRALEIADVNFQYFCQEANEPFCDEARLERLKPYIMRALQLNPDGQNGHYQRVYQARYRTDPVL